MVIFRSVIISLLQGHCTVIGDLKRVVMASIVAIITALDNILRAQRYWNEIKRVDNNNNAYKYTSSDIVDAS